MTIGRIERVGKSGTQTIYDSDQSNGKPQTAIESITRCFADIAPEKLRWLWPGRIPLGKLALLYGDPGLGKSLVTMDIAARVSRGLAFPDGQACESGAVIIANAEDDPADTIRPRLDSAGADVTKVHTLEGMRVTLADNSTVERSFNLDKGMATLEDAIMRIGDVRLIIIDPISAYLGGVDANANAEVRTLLTPLKDFATKHAVTVLCVTHTRKSSGPAVHRAISSIGFIGAARASWAVAADPSDAERRLMAPVKNNLGPNIGGMAFRVVTRGGLPLLDWEPEPIANMDADDVLNTQDHDDHSEQKQAEEWLAEYLTDGPVGASEVIRAASAVGVARSTLYRAANSLSIGKRKLGGRGAGWEWSLQDSKIPAPIYTGLESLESLTTSLETKVDSGAQNSKIPSTPYKESLESLPQPAPVNGNRKVEEPL